MSFLIKNIDTVDVAIDDIGITLVAGDTYDLTQDESYNINTSVDLPAAINAGQIIALDPLDDTTPLSITASLEAIAAFNDPHYRIRGGLLNQLDDVSLTIPSTNDILVFNGSVWKNTSGPTDERVKVTLSDTAPGFLNTKLVAGTGITLTVNNPGGNETLIISSTGGGATPGGADSNVQYNNGGVFGGENNFIYDDINKRIEVSGPAQTTRAIYHIGTDTLDLTQVDKSAVYVQVDGDATFEGLRIFFNRSSAGIDGWITYHYDQATPNLRITDEDDDPPYVSFRTIGTGTFDAPQFESSFGARGTTANRTTGFSWWLGNSTAGGTEIMSCDSNFLLLPSDTTANRPAPAADGMIRYNTTTNKFEGFENGNWINFVSKQSHLFRHNGATTQTFTSSITINFGTNVRTDSVYTHAIVGGGSEITINQSGWYKISYEVTVNDSTGTRRRSTHVLQVNNTNVPGSVSNGYHRNATTGRTTATATVKLNLSVNDTIRVRSSATGSVVTVADGCRLNIESIDSP